MIRQIKGLCTKTGDNRYIAEEKNIADLEAKRLLEMSDRTVKESKKLIACLRKNIKFNEEILAHQRENLNKVINDLRAKED